MVIFVILVNKISNDEGYVEDGPFANFYLPKREIKPSNFLQKNIVDIS